jgi:hypothetical protein
MRIITRKQAKTQGLLRYYTNKPCKRDHIAERITSTSDCVECKQLKEKERYHQNKNYRQEHYQRNRELCLARQKRLYETHYDDILVYQSEWRANNKERISQYRKDNSELYAFHTAKRRATLIQATPKWAEFDMILELYQQAKQLSDSTGVKHEVDHTIPLNHKLVCGLHCIANLQVITKRENCIKHNKYVV